MRSGALLLVPVLTLATVAAQEAVCPFDAPQVVFPSTTAITSVGDFDANGRVDGLGWYWSLQGRFDQAVVRIYMSDLSVPGGFWGGWNITVPVTGGQTASWDTETGELDGNPGTDLAFAFGPDVQVHVAQLLTVGGGTIANILPLAAWQEPFDVHDLQFIDVDHDGRRDVALIGAEVKVYRNTPSGLTSFASFPIAGEELFVGDTDGDGFDDLIVPTAGGVQMLRYRAGGLESFASLVHGVQSSEVPMHVVGDVDLDGDDDVVVFTEGGEYVTMRCLAPEQFAIEPRERGGPATGLADLDGDGDLDGVCCGGGGPGPGRNDAPSTFHIAMNLGGGVFAPAYTVAGLGAFRLAGAVDVDLDGDRDLVAGRTVWFNRGAFPIDPQPDLPALLPPEPFVVSDVDGDGDPDAAAFPGVVFRNDGAGNLTFDAERSPQPPAGTWFSDAIYRADFDGDVDEDRIVEHSDASGLIGMRLLRNTGGGGFVDGGLVLSPGTRFMSPTGGIREDRWHVIGDVDNDGDADIVQRHPASPSGITVYWNDGTGAFTPGPHDAAFSGVPVEITHLDGDPFLDLVTNSGVWFGDGAGGFARGTQFSGWIDPELDHLAVGDLNADGRPDIAMFEHSGSQRVMVCLNQGNRTFIEQSVRSVYAGAVVPRGVAIDDFDRDGHQDLMVWPGYWGEGRRNVVFLFGSSSGWFPRSSIQVLDVQAPPADFDGDGDLDVIGASIGRGAFARPFVDGYRQQYGVSTATGAGFAPTLGASGPLLAGRTIELAVTGAPGAGIVLLGIGGAPTVQIDHPLPGLVGYVAPLDALFAFVASGNPGDEGTGAVRLQVPVPASMAGGSSFLQAWAIDSATLTRLVQTNGLALVFG